MELLKKHKHSIEDNTVSEKRSSDIDNVFRRRAYGAIAPWLVQALYAAVLMS